MDVKTYKNNNLQPVIVGFLNENTEFEWRIHDRLIEFINSLPEHKRFPLICGLAHDLEDETAILMLNASDLTKSEWHNLGDYT